jgi:hypothetical protein
MQPLRCTWTTQYDHDAHAVHSAFAEAACNRAAASLRACVRVCACCRSVPQLLSDASAYYVY